MVWTPTPAARALSVLQTEIGNFIGAPTDTTLAGVITNGLNDGIRKLSLRTRWPWLRTSENVTLVAGTADYELATTTAKAIYAVQLLDTADKEKARVWYEHPATFVEKFPDRSTNGSPVYYTVFNMVADGKISLSSPPSADFILTHPKIKVRLYKRLIYYSGASDTMTTLGGFVPEAENFLVAHAAAYIAAAQWPDKVQMLRTEANQMYEMLIVDANEASNADDD